VLLLSSLSVTGYVGSPTGTTKDAILDTLTDLTMYSSCSIVLLTLLVSLSIGYTLGVLTNYFGTMGNLDTGRKVVHGSATLSTTLLVPTLVGSSLHIGIGEQSLTHALGTVEATDQESIDVPACVLLLGIALGLASGTKEMSNRVWGSKEGGSLAAYLTRRLHVDVLLGNLTYSMMVHVYAWGRNLDQGLHHLLTILRVLRIRHTNALSVLGTPTHVALHVPALLYASLLVTSDSVRIPMGLTMHQLRRRCPTLLKEDFFTLKLLLSTHQPQGWEEIIVGCKTRIAARRKVRELIATTTPTKGYLGPQTATSS